MTTGDEHVIWITSSIKPWL